MVNTEVETSVIIYPFIPYHILLCFEYLFIINYIWASSTNRYHNEFFRMHGQKPSNPRLRHVLFNYIKKGNKDMLTLFLLVYIHLYKRNVGWVNMSYMITTTTYYHQNWQKCIQPIKSYLNRFEWIKLWFRVWIIVCLPMKCCLWGCEGNCSTNWKYISS